MIYINEELIQYCTKRCAMPQLLRCLSVWCRFVLDDLWNSDVLPSTQFAYQKGLGTCDALWCMSKLSHTVQSAFESWYEVRIGQIDFSIAFDMVNRLGILYKPCL